MTHTPLAGVLEWVSVEDASRLLANICEEGVPEEFWGGTYNIGGGDGWRLTNWELEVQMTQAMGVKDPRKMVRPELVRRPELPRTLVHRLGPAPRTRADPPRHHADALACAVAAAPASVRMAGKIPAPLTMSWIDSNDVTKINTYFGFRHEWENIGAGPPSGHPGQAPKEQFLDHRYDEAKSPGAWTIKDMATDDCVTPLDWTCAKGHTLAGSPRLILTAGHWCPECIKTPANYARQTAANSFLAQPESQPPSPPDPTRHPGENPTEAAPPSRPRPATTPSFPVIHARLPKAVDAEHQTTVRGIVDDPRGRAGSRSHVDGRGYSYGQV